MKPSAALSVVGLCALAYEATALRTALGPYSALAPVSATAMRARCTALYGCAATNEESKLIGSLERVAARRGEIVVVKFGGARDDLAVGLSGMSAACLAALAITSTVHVRASKAAARPSRPRHRLPLPLQIIIVRPRAQHRQKYSEVWVNQCMHTRYPPPSTPSTSTCITLHWSSTLESWIWLAWDLLSLALKYPASGIWHSASQIHWWYAHFDTITSDQV